MNETINSIMTRSSTRGFTSQTLTEEEISTLIDAALASPTAMNKQEWHFTFVGPEIIDKLEQAQIAIMTKDGDEKALERLKSRKGKVLYNAAVAVIISVDKDFGLSDIDAGIASENLALAAEGLGLGSVIVGCIDAIFQSDRKEEFEKLLSFPENYRFAMSVVIGHKENIKDQHEKDYSKITRIDI